MNKTTDFYLRSQAFKYALVLHAPFLASRVEIILSAVEDARSSRRGLSDAMRRDEKEATERILSALYECYCSIPSLLLAIPLSSGAYSKVDPRRIPLGYKNVVKVIEALRRLGWVTTVVKGWYDPEARSGQVSRFCASGALAQYFAEVRHRWMIQSPSQNQELIVLKDKDPDTSRKFVIPTPNTSESIEYRVRLEKFNGFLFDHCICLDLPDDRLLLIADELLLNHKTQRDWHKKPLPAINFLRVGLRRIFARGSLEKGGRFYDGWWQNVPSKYRPYITIDGKKTVEIDYSGMALRILYAKEGRDIGEDDPYSIGIPDEDSDLKRPLIKEFVNAILNDDKKKFKLKKSELELLGVSHSQLLKLVEKRHHQIAHHFYTGVGLNLMFLDSVIAEMVMHNLMDLDIVCLPIHDSFIVRSGFEQGLDLAMKIAFKTVVDAEAKVKATYRPINAETESLSRIRMKSLNASEQTRSTEAGVNLDVDGLSVVNGGQLWNLLSRKDRLVHDNFVGSWNQLHPLAD